MIINPISVALPVEGILAPIKGAVINPDLTRLLGVVPIVTNPDVTRHLTGLHHYVIKEDARDSDRHVIGETRDIN